MTTTKRVKEGNKNVKDLKNKSFLLNSFQMKMRFFFIKKKMEEHFVQNGGWVAGFARRIRNTNSYMAELWALRDGLQLCLQMNAHYVIIELDAKVVVDALNSPNSPNSFSSSILEECRHMANQLPQKIFRHVYREANKCADLLARIGLLLDNDFIVFSSPPVDLASVLEADANGVYVNRLYSEPLFTV